VNEKPYRVEMGPKRIGYTPTISVVGPDGVVANETCGDYSARTYDFWVERLNAAYAQGRASAAPKEGEVERLMAECDRLRRELSRERRLMYGVQRLLDEHCRYMEENRELDNAARSALSPTSETVDAQYVVRNAGEYIIDGCPLGARFISDGKISVRYVFGEYNKIWDGSDVYEKTRFRLIKPLSPARPGQGAEMKKCNVLIRWRKAQADGSEMEYEKTTSFRWFWVAELYRRFAHWSVTGSGCTYIYSRAEQNKEQK